MSVRASIARHLATAFLSGEWTAEEVLERGRAALAHSPRFLGELAQKAVAAFPEPERSPDLETLSAFIQTDGRFQRFCRRMGQRGLWPVRRIYWEPPRMQPARGAASGWALPTLAAAGQLADWLGLRPEELDWFADRRRQQHRAPEGRLRHYTYRWVTGRRGKHRLLEMPKHRLKTIQRRILHEILDLIPPHDAVHSYRRGRSIASFVAPHAGQAIVLHFDLRDFFPSIPASRVHAFFRSAGYPRAVARLLTGLCTNAVPEEVASSAPPQAAPAAEGSRIRSAHLPQGAPSSAALSNLCSYRLDYRLAGLANALGARYTRYADDLAFSGGQELARSARRFQMAVCRIALEEGFEVHTRKTRFMRQGVRQQLAGVVINCHANLQRKLYDRLKATLYNCVRHGPETQNRTGQADFRAHLLGQIAYAAMLNPARARRLYRLFAKIRWDSQV